MPRRSQRLAALDCRTSDEGSCSSRATNEGLSTGGLPLLRKMPMERNKRGTKSNVLNRAESTVGGDSKRNHQAGIFPKSRAQLAANFTRSISSFTREYLPSSAQKLLQGCALALSVLLYPRFFKFLVSPPIVAGATVITKSLVPRSLWSLNSLLLATVLSLMICVAFVHLGASKCTPSETSDNLPIQRKGPGAFTTLQEDARHCHMKLEKANKENALLKNQIRPLQDELFNLQSKIQNIVKTAQDVDSSFVKDTTKHHVPTETQEDCNEVDKSNVEEDNTIMETGEASNAVGTSFKKDDTAVSHSSRIPQRSFLSDHSTYPDIIIQLDDQMAVGLSVAIRPIRVMMQKIPRANLTPVTSPQYY